MRRLAWTLTGGFLLLCGVAAADEPALRDEVVRALLDRSRLLGDVQFRVPVPLYRQYVAETVGGPAAAPVAAIGALGRYTFALDAQRRAKLSAQVTLRIFLPRQCRDLAVLTPAMAWQKVSVNGEPAALAVKAGWLRFTAAEPGVYEIAAEAALEPCGAGGGKLAFGVPKTLQTLLAFDAPQAWVVTAAGAPAPLRGRSPEGTHGQLAFAPRGQIELAYAPAVALPPRPPRYELGGAIAWNLDAGRQQVAARIAVRILGGRTERLDLELPAAAAQVSISGPDVREAQVSGGSAAVFLRGAVEGQTRLDVQYELPAAAGVVRLERIALRDGHWAGGVLAITNTAGGSEVLAQAAGGLRELHPADLPEEARAILAGQPVLAYTIASREFAAAVDLVNVGEFALRESIADLAHYQVLLRGDGSVLCKADYEVRNRTRQFLRLELPRGAKVLSARVNDKPQPLTALAGSPDAYLLPLVRSTASVKGLVSFPVQVVVMCRTAALDDRGELALPLPRIDLPIAYGWAELYAPGGLSVRRWAGPLAQVERYGSETAIAALDYGRGELAEGYKMDARPTVEGRPPPKPLEPEKSKPAPPEQPPLLGWRAGGMTFQAKGAPPQPTPPPPATPIPQTGTGILSLDGPVTAPATTRPPELSTVTVTGGELVVKLTPATQPAAPSLQELATVVTIPDGGTVAFGGQVSSGSGVLLGRNYYRAGRDYYERGRYDEAAESLKKAIDLAPKGPEAPNAERLLANIRALRGSLDASGRQEKALAQQVRKEASALNVDLEQQQRRLLEQAQETVRQGNVAEARTQFEAAVSLGEQLVEQGAERGEQEVILRNAKEQLARFRRQDQTRGGELRERFEQLRNAGDYQAAIQTGKALQKLSGDDAGIRRELEALVVHSVRAAAEQSAAQQDLPAQPPQPVPQAAPAPGRGRGTSLSLFGTGRALRPEPAEEPGGLATRLEDRPAAGAGRAADGAPAPEGEEATVTVVRLRHSRAEQVAGAINRIFTSREQLEATQEPVIAPDAASNALVVRASEADRKRIEALAQELDAPAGQAAAPRLGPDQKAKAGAAETDVARGDTRWRAMEAAGNQEWVRRPPGQTAGADVTDGLARRDPGRAIRRAYDVRDLLAPGPSRDKAPGDARKHADDLVTAVKGTVPADAWDVNGDTDVQFVNGRLVVMQTEENQRVVADLLGKLRSVRGPQVEVGASIAQQRARAASETTGAVQGTFLDDVQADFLTVTNGEERRWAVAHRAPAAERMGQRLPESPEFQDFLRRNYDWRAETGGGAGGGGTAGAAGLVRTDRNGDGQVDLYADLSGKLALNLGQKVVVNSTNIGLSAAAARGLGVNFTAGANDVDYAVVDEAQLRTLREMEAAQRGAAEGAAVAPNTRWQETIVGTDALLASGQTANLAFAGDRANTLEISSNTVRLSHEKYVLIDNNGYLTAIKAGAMQHWTEAPEVVQFAEVPQDIDVPRVGRLVKFEKTLIEPADELTIRATYSFQGAAR